jgi:hypothetical protein
MDAIGVGFRDVGDFNHWFCFRESLVAITMNIVLLGFAYDGRGACISIQRTAIMVSSRQSPRFANCVHPAPVRLPSRYDAVVLRGKFRCVWHPNVCPLNP